MIQLDLERLADLSNEEVIEQLCELPGIGRWTAEMILTFSLQRKDIISYSDLAILRGMRMVYHHRRITPQLFTKYKRRYGPYATIASCIMGSCCGSNSRIERLCNRNQKIMLEYKLY